MARSLDMAVLSDLGAQLAAWEDAYVSAVGFERYWRASAWTASEAAKTVAVRMRAATMEVIDRPTPWIGRAWQYTSALSRGTRPSDTVSADAFALDDQSVVMKYLRGDGPQVRLPGDVGLSRDRILVPNWRNLETTQRIKPNRHGNLPGGVAARLKREAAGTAARRRIRGRWGVYEGKIAVGGSRVMGYIARPPPRVKKPEGKNRRMVWRNVRRPRLLLAAIPQATYRPILQRRWVEAQQEALAAVPGIMAAQLEENLRHVAARGRLDQAAALNRALEAIQRAGVSGREDQTRALLAQARSLLHSAGRTARTRMRPNFRTSDLHPLPLRVWKSRSTWSAVRH
ncbi:hypothetical protein [Methylobacterium platani]|nr:hypothetical protein [Methylobacterium platani]